MHRPMLAGNWKMHGDRHAIKQWCQALSAHTGLLEAIDWVLLPPALYLEAVRLEASDLPLAYGSQNHSVHSQGAYTGEIAASMVADLGCTYALVGHSERRSLYHETDEMVAEKAAQALQHGLIPIVCVGESWEAHGDGQTEAVVAAQLSPVMAVYEAYPDVPVVIAYEPVWAIGSGKVPAPEAVQSVHAMIRAFCTAALERDELALSILYGGSVRAANAADLFAMPEVNGFLVGGASLDATEFMTIGENILCNKSS